MESQNTTPGQLKEFLTQVADEYGFFKKDREVFFSRFAQENAVSRNTEIANYLGMPHQEFQDYLREICDKLGFSSSGKGRRRKGESPWELAFTYLWNTKFQDWSVKQGSESSSVNAVKNNWRGVCRVMLKRQRDTQRLRRQATEIGFEVNVHVPLGLVKRTQQQRRSGNIELAQVYQLGQDVVDKTYKHDEFLSKVIGQSQAKTNKHIAIVGEPGAGKTTFLGAIASFIKSKTQDLPIFISLASLQGRTIEEYLLKVWLPEAMGLFNPEVVVMPLIEDELIKQFRKGGVWLLLDGVDEMGADSPVQTLATIQKQLTNWVGQAQVVLTCRLNVWDISVNNTLTGFDTYKTQEFTQEQVDQFIQEWFACAEKPQRGEQLQAKLKEPGREQIRDLVKHPLRLALLCQTFYLDKQGKLAETKVALYQRFNHYFYEWKQNIYPVDLTTRTELHQALGKLALAGINSKARFRLRQSLVCQEMRERLFNLADTLGWLNLIDREAETDEPVYAFLHPMFQEYFAALAVEDWDYFLPRTHSNQNPKPVRDNYPIFEPQWKEVILLWLGREDVPKQQKEEFIKALIEFEDGCGDFYQKQAYLLAVAGIAEFRECNNSEKVVNWLIKYSFGYLSEKQPDFTFILNNFLFEEETRNALAETDREKVVPALVQLLHPDQNENTRLRAAMYLLEFDNTHATAIDALLQLAESDGNKLTCLVAVLSLAGMRIANQVDIPVIDPLVQLIERHENKLTRLFAAWLLETIDPGNQTAANVPLYLIERDENKFTRFLAALLLSNIDSVHEDIPSNLILQLIPNSEWEINWILALYQLAQLREKIERIWKQFKAKSKNGISSLLNLFHQITETSSYDEILPLLILRWIHKIDPEGGYWKRFLDQLFEDTFGKLAEDDEIVIKFNIINQKSEPNFYIFLHSILDTLILRIKEFGESSKQNEDALTVILWLIKTLVGHNPRTETVMRDVLVDGLAALIKITESENILWQTAQSLIAIEPDNETALSALLHLIETTKDEDILLQSSESLAKIDPANETSLNALGHLIETTKDEDILLQASESLRGILPGDQFPKVVAALKHYVVAKVDKDNFDLYEICNDILWRYTQSMTYPAFYCAWHSEPSQVQALENQLADIASQLQPTDKNYPIVINAQTLEGETDTSAIAQALCNRIYRAAIGDDSDMPPEVSNAYQLERLIPQIKKQLQKQNLVLILDRCEPNQAQITFCRKLSDVLHIAWITEAPLEPPLKGFPPEQSNLLNAIQSWIDEIG
jgi:HEAT repeat protein/energy-coupling factor transporter ATP-binding protein EcfA2